MTRLLKIAYYVFVVFPLILILSLLCSIITLTAYTKWYESPKRIGLEKGTAEYKMAEAAIFRAQQLGTESPPLGKTFRRIIGIRKLNDTKHDCQMFNQTYTQEMKQLEVVIEEKYDFGFGETRYRLVSCDGVRDIESINKSPTNDGGPVPIL